MRKFILKQGDLYVSSEIIQEFWIKDRKDFQGFFDDQLDLLFDNHLGCKLFIDLYGKLKKLERYAMLCAHGDDAGKWVYYDGERQFNVQSWVNKHDGKYSGLLLDSCNPGNYTPISKKSILFVPDTDVDFRCGARGKTIFSLLVPGIGEIDSYCIDYELEQLRKKLGE
jgi:hypothetical protein